MRSVVQDHVHMAYHCRDGPLSARPAEGSNRPMHLLLVTVLPSQVPPAQVLVSQALMTLLVYVLLGLRIALPG